MRADNKAFAINATSQKAIHFALQMSRNILSLLLIFDRQVP